MYLEKPKKTLFIPILLTGVQLDPVSYLLLTLVFGGRHHFLGQIVKKHCLFAELYCSVGNTLDNNTPNVDNNSSDSNDDDNNNNHDSDDNNDDKI